MAFQPISKEELMIRIGDSRVPHDLAEMASGGRSVHTDQVARRIRQLLPEFLQGCVEHVKLDIEQNRYVGVQFHGNPRIYTYELTHGSPVDVGDYVMVWSPLTEQDELVRVVRKGRGTWRLSTKIARRVEIAPVG